jgi:hypothetical protein
MSMEVRPIDVETLVNEQIRKESFCWSLRVIASL